MTISCWSTGEVVTDNCKQSSMEKKRQKVQINFFRKQEDNRAELQHNDLLKIIRDEFEEEISLGKISQSTYKNDRGREYLMFELNFSQARQLLARESKYVRKAVIKYIEHLEEQAKRFINLQEQQYIMELTERLNNLEKMFSSMTLDTTKMTIKKYMATRGISNNINTSIMANKAVTICKKQGIKIFKVLEPQYKFVNSYPVEILDCVYWEMLENALNKPCNYIKQ